MRRLLKHASRLPLTLPSALLHSDYGLSLTDLHNRLLQLKFDRFIQLVNYTSGPVTNILCSRLINLPSLMLLPTPSLLFSLPTLAVWSKTKLFHSNFLLCLHFCKLLSIDFSCPRWFLHDVHQYDFPLHEFFVDQPAMFGKHLLQFRR